MASQGETNGIDIADKEATTEPAKERPNVNDKANNESKTLQDECSASEEDGYESDDKTVDTDEEMNEKTQRKFEKAKEIVLKHIKIIKAENDKDNLDTYYETVHKSSKVIGGLYFKLKKQKISQRRLYRRAISDYLIETKGSTVLVETIRKVFHHGWRDEQGSIIKEFYNVFYATIQIMWNFTDSSDTLAKAIADDGMINLTVEIVDKEYENAMAFKIDLSARRIVKSCFAVTANCSFHELSRPVVKQSTILDTVEKMSSAGFEELEIYFVYVPAYIVNEEQSRKMFHDQSIINMIVRHLEKSTSEKTRRSRGFSVHELCVLVGQLAVNDANKSSLAKAGAIELLIKIASGTRKLEKAAALFALEHLSFHDDNKPLIRTAQDLFEELMKNDNKKIRKAAEAIVWNLKTIDMKKVSSSSNNNNPHVMISYQWDSQPWIIQIKDKLQAAGFKVWLDIESMEGSTLGGMADAVENAAVVLIGLSQKYKQSANCRMEAEYAFQLKKDIIPLMMEDDYRPDGWLGMLIGAKLYYKFTDCTDFHNLSSKLIKDLGDRGRVEPTIKESDMTTKFDDILGDMDVNTKGKILVKQQKYEESVDKLRLAVEKGDLNSEETTRPALFTIANMYTQMNKEKKDIKVKYKKVLLRTFLDGKGHNSVLSVMKFCVEHGWRNTDDDSVDDEYWKPFNTSITTWWNFTDLSGQACETALNGGILQILCQVIEREGPLYVKDEDNKTAGRAVRSSLACIYNCCVHSESRDIIREANIVDVFFRPILGITSEAPRTYIIFIMAYTLNEEQSERFFADEGLISYIVGRLAKAASNDKHKDGGYTALELTEGVKRLAVNDSNKIQILKAGGLSPLQTLLTNGDMKEKTAAAETLWVLAFHDENKKEILPCTDLIEELKKLKDGDDCRIKTACEGVLWVLQEQSPTQEQVTTASVSGSGNHVNEAQMEQHVMISYQWNSQPLMIKIKDRLKAEGYNVWMDVEQMGGSTLAAMAAAVENAAAIIMCMTPEYKDSPNCRTEAEYAFQLRKTIVPVKTTKCFKPDGWLGMLLGAKFYFEFEDDDSFKSSTKALIKELGQRGRKATSVRKRRGKSSRKAKQEAVSEIKRVTDVDAPPSSPESSQSPPESPQSLPESPPTVQESPPSVPESSQSPPESPTSPPESSQRVPESPKSVPESPSSVPESSLSHSESPQSVPESPVEGKPRDTVDWQDKDVEKWLNDIGVDKTVFGSITGEQLVYLKGLRKEAPEFFYHYMETYYKVVNLAQLMKFTKALDKLD